jgi:hypothetical protein
MHDLEDLLVQILYACGHSWARSGRRGEVRKPERLVSPPTDELSATRLRRLLEIGSLFTWKGVRATTPTEEELYYIVENDPFGRSPKRIYFIPDAKGQPKFVDTARGVLSTYVDWRSQPGTSPEKPQGDGEDLLPVIKKNFNARRTLHKAINTVRAINRLREGAGLMHGHMDGAMSVDPQPKAEMVNGSKVMDDQGQPMEGLEGVAQGGSGHIDPSKHHGGEAMEVDSPSNA